MTSLTDYLRSLYHIYFQRIRHYVQEVLANPDESENLHQMRTNTRRIRTLLSEFADHFEPTFLQKSKEFFKELIERSNEARDIDVFLEHFEEYEKSLPKSMRSDLVPLKEYLLSKRQEEYERLKDVLKDFTTIDFIEIPQILKSEIEAKEAIKRAIANRKRKIKKLRKKKGCDPRLLHRLRIQYKRLRYLYEMLDGLEDVSKRVKRLKKIQDLLGHYHDLVVQRENILRFVKERTFAIETILAAGKLVGDIEERSEKLCRQIARKDLV